MIKVNIVKDAPILVRIIDHDVIVRGEAQRYVGDYTVTPKLEEEVVLETKDKLMVDNVTVRRIPIYKTRNATGGYTIYVAERTE